VRRLVIFIDAEESNVEIVAWISKVIGVAAEKRGVELRREHQTNIRVLLVLIEVVDLSGIKNDHVTAQSRGGRTIFFNL